MYHAYITVRLRNCEIIDIILVVTILALESFLCIGVLNFGIHLNVGVGCISARSIKVSHPFHIFHLPPSTNTQPKANLNLEDSILYCNVVLIVHYVQ